MHTYIHTYAVPHPHHTTGGARGTVPHPHHTTGSGVGGHYYGWPMTMAWGVGGGLERWTIYIYIYLYTHVYNLHWGSSTAKPTIAPFWPQYCCYAVQMPQPNSTCKCPRKCQRLRQVSGNCVKHSSLMCRKLHEGIMVWRRVCTCSIDQHISCGYSNWWPAPVLQRPCFINEKLQSTFGSSYGRQWSRPFLLEITVAAPLRPRHGPVIPGNFHRSYLGQIKFIGAPAYLVWELQCYTKLGGSRNGPRHTTSQASVRLMLALCSRAFLNVSLCVFLPSNCLFLLGARFRFSACKAALRMELQIQADMASLKGALVVYMYIYVLILDITTCVV